jgi:hypothetical protein
MNNQHLHATEDKPANNAGKKPLIVRDKVAQLRCLILTA